jgi:hypothetical protein
VGNVISVAAVERNVVLNAPFVTNVEPSASCRVAEFVGAVIATLFIDVADATPRVGVVKVGLEANTTFPVPVAAVAPVPPFAIGNAVPERVTANVPEPVIGLFATDKNEGTVIPTDVTVPLPPATIACHSAVVAEVAVKT